MHTDIQKSFDRLTKDARMLHAPEFTALPLMGGTIEIGFGIERFGDRPFTVIRTTSPLVMAGVKVDFVWCMEGHFVLDAGRLAQVSAKPQVAVADGLVAFGGIGIGGDSLEYPTYGYARDRMGERIRELVAQVYPVMGAIRQDDLHDLLLQAVADGLERFRTRPPRTGRELPGPLHGYEEKAMEGLVLAASALPMASRSHCFLIENDQYCPVRLRFDGRGVTACSFDTPAGRMAGIVWPSLMSLLSRIDRTFRPRDETYLTDRFIADLGVTLRIASVSWDAIEVLEGNASGEPGRQVDRHGLKHEDVVDWSDLVVPTGKDTVPA